MVFVVWMEIVFVLEIILGWIVQIFLSVLRIVRVMVRVRMALVLVMQYFQDMMKLDDSYFLNQLRITIVDINHVTQIVMDVELVLMEVVNVMKDMKVQDVVVPKIATTKDFASVTHAFVIKDSMEVIAQNWMHTVQL